MLCDLCKSKPAKVFINKIEADKVVEYNICESCAVKVLGKGSSEYSIMENEFINNLSDILNSFAEFSSDNKEYAICCERCGTDIGDLMTSGRIGCPECYKVFEPHLMPLLKRLHGTLQHAGKSPYGIEAKQKLEELQIILKDLIEKEEYERAAVIRDKIRELKDASA